MNFGIWYHTSYIPFGYSDGRVFTFSDMAVWYSYISFITLLLDSFDCVLFLRLFFMDHTVRLLLMHHNISPSMAIENNELSFVSSNHKFSHSNLNNQFFFHLSNYHFGFSIVKTTVIHYDFGRRYNLEFEIFYNLIFFLLFLKLK